MDKKVIMECKSSDNKVFDCVIKDSQESEETDMIETEYFGKVNINQKSESNLIMGIFLSTLIGGFGFATAYLLLYELYDWITLGDAYNKEIWRFVVALVVLLGLLIGIILISYYILKKKSSQEVIKHTLPESIRK